MYVEVSEVEEFAGIAYTDLKVAGRTMTQEEWQQFVLTYQTPIAELIHRYCRVQTFDPFSSNAQVIEYKSGRGNTSDSYPYIRGSSGSYYTQENYSFQDIEFYLKHLYYTGTQNGVTRAAVVVEEDTADKTAIPAWTARTARGIAAGGDYEVYTEDELTMIRFHNNVPARGTNNIRFTYYTGYDPTSDQYLAIKLQVLRCFKNFIMLKKKTQEPFTIRAHGVRDFQTMFEPFDESHILGDNEKASLEPYRRFPIPGDMFS
jgi:hypothetical protein